MPAGLGVMLSFFGLICFWRDPRHDEGLLPTHPLSVCGPAQSSSSTHQPAHPQPASLLPHPSQPIHPA